MAHIKFLGTGTSQGVPVIGCDCEVCKSPDHKDYRLRSAVWLHTANTSLVIDIGPDFRQQMLHAGVKQIDALLITHAHMDHVSGLDDIRPFNHRSQQPIKVFAEPQVQNRIRHQFDYAFKEPPYPGVPQISFENLIPYQNFRVGDFDILPLRALHGNLPVVGFRVGDLAYITDVNCLPDRTVENLKGCKTFILSALHHKKHHSHFNLEEALGWFEKIGAEHNFITHISHQMGLHQNTQKTLPSGVFLSFDGLEVPFNP
jgi:phosphoribosyl 1,2-cyclic phosphate phosphodiesterase